MTAHYVAPYSGFVPPAIYGKSYFDVLIVSKVEDTYYPELEVNLMNEGSDFELILESNDTMTELTREFPTHNVIAYKDSFVLAQFVSHEAEDTKRRIATKEETNLLLELSND